MPTYEYACMSCGNHVEVYQRFSDQPLTECGVCGGALRKVFHPAGILFKGSGFYATDSRVKAGKGSGDGDKADTKADADGGKRDGSKGSEQRKASGASDGARKADSSSSSEGSTGSKGSTKEKSA